MPTVSPQAQTKKHHDQYEARNRPLTKQQIYEMPAGSIYETSFANRKARRTAFSVEDRGGTFVENHRKEHKGRPVQVQRIPIKEALLDGNNQPLVDLAGKVMMKITARVKRIFHRSTPKEV